MPLETLPEVFTWLCITYTDDKSVSYWQKMARITVRSTFVFGLIGAMTLVTISSLKLISTNLEESLYGFFQLGVVAITLVGFISMITAGSRLANIFDTLISIHDTCKIRIKCMNSMLPVHP